tara:strand:- start:657 stop:851 length:195 start_codon:yes stop_codon:yes gene_type:complete
MKDLEKRLVKQEVKNNLTQQSLKKSVRKESKISEEHTINNTKYRLVEEWEGEDAFFDYVVEKFR